MNAMRWFTRSWPRAKPSLVALFVMATVGIVSAITSRADLPAEAVTQEQVLRGRLVVVSHDCGGCHSGGNGSNPSGARWLSGIKDEAEAFPIGPFKTRPRNLT